MQSASMRNNRIENGSSAGWVRQRAHRQPTGSREAGPAGIWREQAMAAMKPRTGDGPLEATKEGRGIVMRVPLEGGEGSSSS